MSAARRLRPPPTILLYAAAGEGFDCWLLPVTMAAAQVVALASQMLASLGVLMMATRFSRL